MTVAGTQALNRGPQGVRNPGTGEGFSRPAGGQRWFECGRAVIATCRRQNPCLFDFFRSVVNAHFKQEDARSSRPGHQSVNGCNDRSILLWRSISRDSIFVLCFLMIFVILLLT